MPAVSAPEAAAAAIKSAGLILANDNQPRRAARVPAYVPPAAARTRLTTLPDPSDVDDITQIGEHKDGKLYLRFASVPKTLFVFSNVPPAVIAGLRSSLSRDEFYEANIKDRPEYPMEVITAAKK